MMPKKRFGTDIRQEQIAEAALDIVQSEGLGGLNVAAVADKVGIVPSAVYRHYRNKSEIIGAVLQLIRTRLNARYKEIIQQEAEPIEKLHGLLLRHIELISSNNAIPRIIFSEEVIGGMPEKQAQLYGIIQDVLGNVASVIIEGQKKCRIRGDIPPEHIAAAFLGMIQPAAIIWSLSHGEFDLIQHSRYSWRLFQTAISTGNGEKDELTLSHGSRHEEDHESIDPDRSGDSDRLSPLQHDLLHHGENLDP